MGGFGKILQGSQVRDDGDAAFGDAKILFEEGGEVRGGDDDAVAGAELASFDPAVGFSDEFAEEGHLGADFAVDGEAGKVLQPKEERGPEGAGGFEDGALGCGGGMDGDDAVGAPGSDEPRDLSAVGDFQAAAAQEGSGRRASGGSEGQLAQDQGGGVAGAFD